MSVTAGPRPVVRATARVIVDPGALYDLRTCVTTAARRTCAHDSTRRGEPLATLVRVITARRPGRPTATQITQLRRNGRVIASSAVPTPRPTVAPPTAPTTSPSVPAPATVFPSPAPGPAAPASTVPAPPLPAATLPHGSECDAGDPVGVAASPPLQPYTLANAPAYNELAVPTGQPRGAILLLHGGGFLNTGPYAASSERPQAIRWLQRGWVVLNATYRPCRNAPGDAEWFYDRLAERHPGLPLCVSGSSAGASLAAHLVTVRDVSCLVSRAGILDPETLLEQHDAVQRPGQEDGGPRLHRIYTGALGEEGRRTLIDQSRFARSPARMLIVGEDNDHVVPRSQQTDALIARNDAAAGDRTTGLFLAGVDADPYFVHSQVSSLEHARYVQAEEALARSVERPGR